MWGTTCGNQPSCFALQVDKPTMEYVYKPKRSQMGETWKHSGCIWWSIWIERNKRCFVQSSLQILKMNCLGLFYFWCEQILLAQTEDVFDVLDFL